MVRGGNSLCLIGKLSLPPKYKYFIRFYLKDSLFDLLQNVGSRTVQVPALPLPASSTVSEDVFFSKEKQGPSCFSRVGSRVAVWPKLGLRGEHAEESGNWASLL